MSNTTDHVFSDSQNFTIVIFNYLASALGVLGATFTITTYLLFKDARNVATSLIFCLALSDFCSSLGDTFIWMWFDHSKWFVCNLQAFMLMFGLIASLMWGFMIGLYMFMALYINIEVETIDRFRFFFHFFAWGYAFSAALIPIFFNEYGIMYPGSVGTLQWCWVHDPKSKFRFALYAPDTVVFVLLVLLYGMIQFRLRGIPNSAAQAICKKMNIYLLTYAIINFFAIVNRLQNFVFNSGIFELYVCQFATQPLQGFLNAIAYAWNEPAFLDNYKNLIMKYTSRHVSTAEEKADNEKLLSYVRYDDDDI